MNRQIQRIIAEYGKSIAYSEAEIRSKLIVPLLDALGYPSYLRAEEFPVYGFEGGKALPAKNADFILFSDKYFNNHREKTKQSIEWVYKHSLLVVEAKKPGEMPDILGQPTYYSVWTRAVGYLAIDGDAIKGYLRQNISSDFQIIDCHVKDLPNDSRLETFSFENILLLKENAANDYKHLVLNDVIDHDNINTYRSLTEEDLKSIPENTIQYMRIALGKNADGLNRVELISRYLNTTDLLLQNDLRYEVPKYIFQIPRRVHKAHIHIDGNVLPFEVGEVTEFYWEDYDRFIFESEYIFIDIMTLNKELNYFDIGFRVLDARVSDRLISFERVKRILTAVSIRVSLEEDAHRSFVLPNSNPQKLWARKESVLEMCDFWRKGLEQLKAIEEFYEIEFELRYVTAGKDVADLYKAIDLVYAGIVISQNCEILLPGGIAEENVKFDEPTVFEEEIATPFEELIIHNIHFVPYKSWLLPGTIYMKGTKKGDIVKAPGCCVYKIVKD